MTTRARRGWGEGLRDQREMMEGRGEGDGPTEQQRQETRSGAARQPRAEALPAHRLTAPGSATVWLRVNSGAPRSRAGCTAPGAAAPHTSWTPRGA